MGGFAGGIRLWSMTDEAHNSAVFWIFGCASMNYHQYNSAVGRLLLFSDGRALKKVTFLSSSENETLVEHASLTDGVLAEACRQLDEWFAGERQSFDLPLAPDGSEFQQQVWQELQNIPFGSTCSYGELAKRLGKPSAARAVGAANGQNPIALIIPCHRVIGCDGSMTGYAFGLERKKKLLAFEAQHQLQLF